MQCINLDEAIQPWPVKVWLARTDWTHRLHRFTEPEAKRLYDLPAQTTPTIPGAPPSHRILRTPQHNSHSS